MWSTVHHSRFCSINDEKAGIVGSFKPFYEVTDWSLALPKTASSTKNEDDDDNEATDDQNDAETKKTK